MPSFVEKLLHRYVEPFLANTVYVQPSGPAKGLKRQGGLGFLARSEAPTREQQLIESLDLKGKVVFDIGASVGIMTLCYARKTGPAGRVIAFEPNPANFRALCGNIRANNFSHVTAVQKGIGSETGNVTFVIPESGLGTAEPSRQQRYSKERSTKTITIEIESVDTLIKGGLPVPDFIKLDTEGFEWEALTGMRHLLQEKGPDILVELHGIRQEEIVLLLLDSGYRLHQIENAFPITKQNISAAFGHIFASKSIAPIGS